MSESRKIKRNTFFSLVSITARLGANVLLFWTLARFYSPEKFGQFTLAHTLATTLVILADFGLDVLLTTEVAKSRNRADVIFLQFFPLKVIFTFCSMIVMSVLALILDFSEPTRALILTFNVFLVFTATTNFLNALFKGFERLEYETKVSVITNLFLLIATALLIAFRVDLILIALVFGLSRLLGFIIAIRFSFRIIPNIKIKLVYEDIRRVRKKIFVFGFHFMFSYLFFQLDTLLLAFLKGDYSVGIYQSVFKLIMLPLVIPEIFVNVLLPTLSRMNLENPSQWRKTGLLMNKILLIVVSPISIIIYVYSNQIITFIYGANYSDAGAILEIFAVILVVRFGLEPFALMLTTSNRQIIRMKVVISATVINLILNLILIPIYGVKGAAFVSLITNSIVGLAYLFSNLKLAKSWMLNLRFMSLFVVIGIVICLIYYFNNLSIIIIAIIVLSVFGLWGFFVFFTKDEKRILLSNELKFFVSRL